MPQINVSAAAASGLPSLKHFAATRRQAFFCPCHLQEGKNAVFSAAAIYGSKKTSLFLLPLPGPPEENFPEYPRPTTGA